MSLKQGRAAIRSLNVKPFKNCSNLISYKFFVNIAYLMRAFHLLALLYKTY